MRTLAMLSMHTSPLTQPGSGDSGGMNVYVRELVSSLAQAGVACTVYVRSWRKTTREIRVNPRRRKDLYNLAAKWLGESFGACAGPKNSEKN